jgi:hypothetical protein
MAPILEVPIAIGDREYVAKLTERAILEYDRKYKDLLRITARMMVVVNRAEDPRAISPEDLFGVLEADKVLDLVALSIIHYSKNEPAPKLDDLRRELVRFGLFKVADVATTLMISLVAGEDYAPEETEAVPLDEPRAKQKRASRTPRKNSSA